MHQIKIIDFEEKYSKDFFDLNMEWLEAYFDVEPYDREVLSKPKQYIMDDGGIFLFAKAKDKVVGTLALIDRQDQGYELSKMAVTSGYQGHRIGQKLIYAAIHRAGTMGTSRLFLDSNTKLAPAINLYKKVGFREVKEGYDSPYDRCNIRMEIMI